MGGCLAPEAELKPSKGQKGESKICVGLQDPSIIQYESVKCTVNVLMSQAWQFLFSHIIFQTIEFLEEPSDGDI